MGSWGGKKGGSGSSPSIRNCRKQLGAKLGEQVRRERVRRGPAYLLLIRPPGGCGWLVLAHLWENSTLECHMKPGAKAIALCGCSCCSEANTRNRKGPFYLILSSNLPLVLPIASPSANRKPTGKSFWEAQLTDPDPSSTEQNIEGTVWELKDKRQPYQRKWVMGGEGAETFGLKKESGPLEGQYVLVLVPLAGMRDSSGRKRPGISFPLCWLSLAVAEMPQSLMTVRR